MTGSDYTPGCGAMTLRLVAGMQATIPLQSRARCRVVLVGRSHVRWCQPSQNTGDAPKRSCVPDLTDRATFLLGRDELARRAGLQPDYARLHIIPDNNMVLVSMEDGITSCVWSFDADPALAPTEALDRALWETREAAHAE